jgi:acyl-CoA thioester hydrolase
MIHSTTFPLRFCDTDMLGHVNNAVFASVYEAGRTEFLADTGLLAVDSGFSPVIVRLEIDFLREMNWPGTVTVETIVTRIGNKSFHTSQRALLNGEICSRAVGVIAVIDLTTRRSVPLTDAWKAVLARYCETPAS